MDEMMVKLKKIEEMRQQGMEWADVSKELCYTHEGGAAKFYYRNMAKLKFALLPDDDEIVIKIRDLVENGVSRKDAAKQLGVRVVDVEAVCKIKLIYKKREFRKKKFDDVLIKSIGEMIYSGKTTEEIIEKTGINKAKFFQLRWYYFNKTKKGTIEEQDVYSNMDDSHGKESLLYQIPTDVKSLLMRPLA